MDNIDIFWFQSSKEVSSIFAEEEIPALENNKSTPPKISADSLYG